MIIKDGFLINTEEDNRKVEELLNNAQKVKCKVKETGETFTLPMLTTESDLHWHKQCLKSRLEHPERYADSENVTAVIADLRRKITDIELANQVAQNKFSGVAISFMFPEIEVRAV